MFLLQIQIITGKLKRFLFSKLFEVISRVRFIVRQLTHTYKYTEYAYLVISKGRINTGEYYSGIAFHWGLKFGNGAQGFIKVSS